MNNTTKTVVRHSLAAITSFLCFSCINSSVQPLEQSNLSPPSNNIPIAISAQILQVQVHHTRITNNSFDENDAIGLYVLAQPANLSGIRHIENMRFIYSSGGFTPDEEIYYPKGDAKCDFISYYPYQEGGVATGSSNIQVGINANQSSVTDYSNSDFMVAESTGITPSRKAVNLKHNHKFCQLNITLQLNNIEKDINDLQNNASISITNINTKATYNINTELFSSFNTKQNITPYGQWEADEENRQLAGKKAILIPQPTTDCEVVLRTKNKIYSAALPTDLVLESETSCELLLIYDSRVGIEKIMSSIGDWKPGNNGNATLEEKENNKSINIAGLNFEETGIYNLATSENINIGEICKEYLLNDDINAQAIVLYPGNNKQVGTVLQLLGENRNLHGGSVSWDKTNNSFTYTPGNKTPIEEIYVDKSGNIIFEENEEVQQVKATEYVLTDTRGSETVVYPVVKIGTQYWMRENLNTTKYNDATAIPNNTASLTKTTAGYYLNESSRFYNQTIITTGKIAPSGWKIPDNTEWNKLRAYIKDQAATLKAGIWISSEGILPANNKTGFNGQPVGFYSKNKNNNESHYGYSQKYAGYWTVGNNQTTLYENSFSLSNVLNTIGGVANTDYSAYSIRCIKE